jgi:hypothetical protein
MIYNPVVPGPTVCVAQPQGTTQPIEGLLEVTLKCLAAAAADKDSMIYAGT